MTSHTHSMSFCHDVEQVTTNLWSPQTRDEYPTQLTVADRLERSSTGSVFRNSTVVVRDMILPPSPPPQPDRPTHPQPPMQVINPAPTDARITSLKAIFPDFDDTVILSVLESTNNDHDHALDVLLGMSDPSFVPPNPPSMQPPDQIQSAPSADAQRLSQEALDEQLARRLALEEQRTATQTWQPQGVEGQTMYQPYQSRRGGRNGWGGRPQSPPQIQNQSTRDTMTEFQEGFNRIAESGKKTFSSIVSKVKSKVQEFDQGQGWSWYQNQPASQPSSSDTPGQQQGSLQGAYAQPYQPTPPADPTSRTSQPQPVRTNSYTSSPPRSEVLRPMSTAPAQPATTQQSTYHDPSPRGYDFYSDDEEIQINDKTTPAVTTAPAAATSTTTTTQRLATTPHVDVPTSAPPSSGANTLPSHAPPVSSLPNSESSPPTRSLSPTMTGPKGTAPGAPGGVDFSKLGLLPKRPISLVRPQSPPNTGAGGNANVSAPRMGPAHSQSTTGSSTDHEEPEFVENPFEDRK